MNYERRKRILEQITQFVQSYVTPDLVDAIESGDITPEEIIVKINLELMRGIRGTR